MAEWKATAQPPPGAHEPQAGDFYRSRDARERGRTVRLMYRQDDGRWRVEDADTYRKTSISEFILWAKFEYREGVPA